MPNPDVKKIGKYEIQAELGQGGFGRVYRAFDPTVGRPVALKILMTEGNRDLLTRFRNEATSAGNLQHRNIVTIYDFGEFSGRPYLVMELLEGEDLTQTISSGKKLTLLQKMNVMDQVADGLECAHSNGVVHRDVKPANIRLLPDGTVKILDFGIARVSRDQKGTRLTQQGDLIGTILYVSPEQFGGADADALCDIFAYGVTYYEFLAGKHPFGSSDPRSVMFKITMEDPPSLRSLVPECPEALEQILNRALHKDRELRYQSLRDLRLDTEPLIIELKQDRARQFVAEARELSAHETPQEALTLINDALVLDPGNAEARQLREMVRRRLQKKALQPRVDAMLETAQDQLSKGAVSQAVQTLESAHKLDPSDARISDLLDSAREQLKTVKDAARLAIAALAHLNRGEWPAAFEKGSEAARLDTSNKEAARVLDAVQKYERDLASRIEGQIVSGDLDSAISGLQDLAALRPESAEIRKRLEETTANQAGRERVRKVVEQAQQLIAQTQFAAAAELLAGSGLPDEPNVTALRRQAEEGLSARKRADAVAKAAQNAASLLRASRIDEALQEIESSLGLYPGERILVELREAVLEAKAARERDHVVQTATSDCNRLGAENRFAEALETVQAALLKLPADPKLLVLLESLQAQKERQDRADALRRAIDEGRRLVEFHPEEAVEFLQNATVQYPESDRLKQLMAQADEELRSRQRRKAVNKAVDETRQRVGRSDFEGALDVLRSALKLFPDDAVLLELRQITLNARQERRRAVDLLAQHCEQLIQSASFADALRVVQEALRKYSDDPLLLEKLQRAQEELERQTKAVRGVLARATELEDKFDFVAALTEIDAGLARYPGEKSLTERHGALESAQSEFVRLRDQEAALQRAWDFVQRSHTNVRDEDIDGMLEEAKALAHDHSTDRELYRAIVDGGQHLLDLRQGRAKAAAGDLEGARALSDGYLRRFPEHAGFLALQNQIAERERQIAIEYKAELKKVLHGGSDRGASGIDQRVRVLDEALRRYPHEPYYRKELELLKSAGALADSANSLEKAAQFREAGDLWNRIGSTYPSYPGLQARIERAEQLYQQARRDARTRWSEHIQKALNEGSYAQSLELTAKAEIDFPGEFNQLAIDAKQGADRQAQVQRLLSDAKDLMSKTQWATGQAKLREAMESAGSDPGIGRQVIDAHAKYAGASLASGDWRAADALLRQASSLHPDFQAPIDLRSRIEERERVEFVEQALIQSRRLQQSGKVQAALDEVLKALEIYPQEPELEELRSSLENALREAARQHEKKRALEELRRLEAATGKTAGIDELERILERADMLARAYPEDGDFASRFDSILKQVEALRRARRLLDEGKFDESEKTADEMLARIQDHPAFSTLKRAVRDAREQAASAYRDEITRKLENERILGLREAILVEALQRYPGELYFKAELDSVREKQQLVARVLKDARDAEQAGRYEEALDQWEKLRALDAGYPKLDTEIQRLRALLASARTAALETALTEVRRAIERGSLQQAASLLSRIESEFGTAASGDCVRLRARLDGLIEAMRLADEGRGLFAKGECAAGSTKLFQAARRVPNERAIVQGLLGELIQQAEAVVESDWRAADSILEAGSDLKSDSEMLQVLRARVEEGRRKEFVAEVLRESQRLRDAGDLRSAENSIQKALARYPAEARLAEQLAGIRSALAEEARLQRRDQVIAELTAITKEAETTSLKRLRKATKQIDTVLARTPSDPEVQARATEVRNVLATRISELAAPRRQVPSASPATAQPIAEPASVAGGPKLKLMVIGAGAAALIGGLITIVRWSNTGHQIPVSVTSDVAGASVTVGNQSCVTPVCDLKLPAGTYTLIAKKNGFKTITLPVTVAPRQAELRFPLLFEPLPQVLQVNTNFESGLVFLDGHPAGSLRDGQFSTAGLAPGQHTIRVTGGGADFQTTWRSAIGAGPELVGQLEAKDVQATVIANAGSTAAIACNCGVQNVTVDGAPAGQTQAVDGTSSPLQNLSEGSRRFSVAGHSLILNVRPNPTLSVFLSLDREVGTIVVEAGEDNARIYLNNRVYRRTTQGGTVRIPVDVGEYSVRVEKNGFQGSPAQTIAVRKGDEARVVATLTPVPPVMEIVAALPGAQVKVDGHDVGKIASNGALRIEVAPGEHLIELTKDDYSPARFTTQFSPGKTVLLDQRQLPMARVVQTPPALDPSQIDAQDWDRVRNSNNIDSFDDYVRKHADGAHVDEARTMAARLRQEAQSNAARQAEQAAWDVTDKANKAALQNFVSRYGNGVHAQEARGLISGIERQESEAIAATQRAKELKDREQEQANRAAADQQSIGRLLAAYTEAYNRMDLKTLQDIWDPMPKNVSDSTGRQFRGSKSLAFQMSPLGQAAVNRDSAVITCTRTLTLIPRTGERLPSVNERVRVTLKRVGPGWLISSIDVF